MKIFNMRSSDNLLIEDMEKFTKWIKRFFVAYLLFFFILFVIQTENDSQANISTSTRKEDYRADAVYASSDSQELDGETGDQETIKEEVAIVDRIDATEEESIIPSVSNEVVAFANSYPGGRLDKGFIDLLASEIEDPNLLKLAVAISVSESGMGKAGLAKGKQSNFWNIFPEGNRAWDPSKEVMATKVASLVEDSYWMANTDFWQAKCYVKGCKTVCTDAKCIAEVKNWQYNINDSINDMK